jgi:predicted nucleic acid-binding protein
MTRYIIDTNVTVAWYFNEEFSPSAREWQDRMIEGKAFLIVPSLHYWEFGNALRTHVIRNILDEDLAQEIFTLHLDSPIEVLEPDRNAVLTNAFEYRATTYDAVFITLALSQDIQIITAERTTTHWVTKLGSRAIIVR